MSKLKKAMYLLVGLIAFVLGFIGIFLPLLPTTPLFLLTSFCLLKSSEKLNEKFICKIICRKRWNDFKSKTLLNSSSITITTVYVYNYRKYNDENDNHNNVVGKSNSIYKDEDNKS